MPPHGHHGHGGHGHHGHGGGPPGVYVAGWGPGYGPSWDPGANYNLVTIENDPDTKARAMAYIMKLPPALRGQAYRSIFGKEPPAGALSGLGGLLDTLTDGKFLTLAAIVGALWWFMPRDRGRTPSRHRARQQRRAHEHAQFEVMKARKKQAYRKAVAQDRSRR